MNFNEHFCQYKLVCFYLLQKKYFLNQFLKCSSYFGMTRYALGATELKKNIRNYTYSSVDFRKKYNKLLRKEQKG